MEETEQEEMQRLARVAAETAERWDDAEDIIDVLNEEALEAYANVKQWGDGRREVTSVTVVLGTGGPHYQFQVTPDGQVYGQAWGWFREHEASHYGRAETLGAYLAEIYEEIG